MARTPSSARRKRRQHALASPRPARAAHQDARPEESFCFTLSTKGPGVSGKIKMEWHGSSLSLIAKAVAVLIAGMIVFFRLGTRQPGPGRHRYRRPQR